MLVITTPKSDVGAGTVFPTIMFTMMDLETKVAEINVNRKAEESRWGSITHRLKIDFPGRAVKAEPVCEDVKQELNRIIFGKRKKLDRVEILSITGLFLIVLVSSYIAVVIIEEVLGAL